MYPFVRKNFYFLAILHYVKTRTFLFVYRERLDTSTESYKAMLRTQNSNAINPEFCLKRVKQIFYDSLCSVLQYVQLPGHYFNVSTKAWVAQRKWDEYLSMPEAVWKNFHWSWCSRVLESKPLFEPQARHQNKRRKIFRRRFPLSRFLAKTLRVNKINCNEKFLKKSVVRSRL